MTATKKNLPQLLLIAGLLLLLCAEGYFGYKVSTLSSQQERIKEDYSVSNNITFGIFSIDEWRAKIAAIVDGKVNNFDMTAEQKRNFRLK